jgi:hypothetical protein
VNTGPDGVRALDPTSTNHSWQAAEDPGQKSSENRHDELPLLNTGCQRATASRQARAPKRAARAAGTTCDESSSVNL